MSPPDLRDVLPPATLAAWPKVAAALPEGAYLAGGTAIALHLRHRTSRDLDVFVPVRFDPASVRDRLAEAGSLTVTLLGEGTLNGVLDGAKVQFLEASAHRNLDEPTSIEGIPVAGLRDLLADKLKVVGDRGQLRDYFDLMQIERRTRHRCEQGLAYYRHRYGVGAHDASLAHIVAALGYLDDVADDPGLPGGARDDLTAYWARRQPEIARNLRSESFSHGLRDHPRRP